jgi:glycosyltransferase involved in cell wall biosynthesis
MDTDFVQYTARIAPTVRERIAIHASQCGSDFAVRAQWVVNATPRAIRVDCLDEHSFQPGKDLRLTDSMLSDGQSSRVRVVTPRVIVVMPAYNAARTLEKTYGDLPSDLVYEVILVDDASQDETVEIARRLNLKCIVHSQNTGYGGNQKTCYVEALQEEADIVVMLHPDNQYDATRIPSMIAPIAAGRADMVLGSRLFDGASAARAGGMPFWKLIANRFLTAIENKVFDIHCSELHTGYRAYSARLLRSIPFQMNSDDFVFDTEIIAQVAASGFPIEEVSVPTRYFPEASSVNFRRSVVYGIKTLNVLQRFLLHKYGIRSSEQFECQTVPIT